MADRDAKVRLNLAANGFLSQLQQLRSAAKEFEKAVEGVGDGGEKASRKLGAFGSAAKAGLGAAKTALSELGSSLKSTLGQVATLGGALSAANAARGAVEVTKTYKDLANAIEAGTGVSTDWQTVQKSIEGTASRWKRSNSEVAQSYRMLWDDIGDAKFAAAGIESVARAATAGHGSIGALTNIVGQLKEKFDIPAEGIDDALASVIAMGNKGGANVEQLGEKIGLLGASAKEAGIEGQAGLTKMVSMLNLADGVTGNFRKSLKAVTGIFDTLGDPEKLKNISKELHLGLVDKTTKKPFAHALEMILAKSGGKQEILGKVFSGEELKLVTEFGKTYQKAFDATTGTLQAKMKAGLDAYGAALKEAGKQTTDAAAIDAQAKARLGDVDRQIADALRKLEIAFTKPEMVDGLTKLAEVAPKVADALAKLLGFAVDHPKTAVAAVVGAKVAGSVVPAVAGSLLAAGGKAAWKAIAARVVGTAAAGEGAAAAAGGAGATGAGIAAVAVPVAAALAAGAAGYGVGSIAANALTGSRLKTKNDAMLGLTDATVVAHSVAQHGTDAQKQTAAARLREQIAANRKTGVFGGIMDEGYNAIARTVDRSYRDPQQVAIVKASKELDALERSLKKGSTGGDRIAGVFDRISISAERMDRVLSKFGGSDGTNGLPPAPGNESGSTPR